MSTDLPWTNGGEGIGKLATGIYSKVLKMF